MWQKLQALRALDPAWPLMWALAASCPPWCPCLTLSQRHEQACPLHFKWKFCDHDEGTFLLLGLLCCLCHSPGTCQAPDAHLFTGCWILTLVGPWREELHRGSQRTTVGAQERRRIRGEGKGRKETNLTTFHTQHICSPRTPITQGLVSRGQGGQPSATQTMHFQGQAWFLLTCTPSVPPLCPESAHGSTKLTEPPLFTPLCWSEGKSAGWEFRFQIFSIFQVPQRGN